AGAGVAGLCAGALAASPAMAGRGGRGVAGIVVVALLGCAVGMSAWDRLLTARAGSRQRRVEAAVPDASELLALAVGAGESVPAALDRVASLSHSDLGDELARAVADIRLGAPSARALTDLAARNDSPALSRLCQTLSTAIERGSPLAAVLHDQARDIREASRQRLMEEGGKREIAMLFPVVFLILPVTVLFALYPGLMALDITP
ncbi:type II secretion system protein F, partial [Schaalia georgiae F0490]